MIRRVYRYPVLIVAIAIALLVVPLFARQSARACDTGLGGEERAEDVNLDS
jgi:hypothetical protein